MKTYKHLYERIVDPDNVLLSIVNASKGKRHRKDVRAIFDDPEPTCEKIIKQLNEGTWNPPKHKPKILKEGSHKKERSIVQPYFEQEQIVHHMLISQLKPIILPGMYELSCGSIPGRGSLQVVKAIKKWVKDYGSKVFYVAELDIKKFYKNIDQQILKQQLQRIIKDDRYLEVLFKVIDAHEEGLPLGYYTSPWLGNLYLTPMDRYILHTLHPDHYARYMDNLFLFSDDKEKLHGIVRSLMEFCQTNLHLSIKNDWQVFQFEHLDTETGKVTGRAINCLGFVIHYNRVTLRKSLLKRIRAKALRMHKNKQCTVRDAQAMISYSGWLQNSNTYNYYLRYIKPNISFRYCKKVVKQQAKRSDDNDGMVQEIQQCGSTP